MTQNNSLYRFFPFRSAILGLTTHPCPSTSIPIFPKLVTTFTVPGTSIFIDAGFIQVFIYQVDAPIFLICDTSV